MSPERRRDPDGTEHQANRPVDASLRIRADAADDSADDEPEESPATAIIGRARDPISRWGARRPADAWPTPSPPSTRAVDVEDHCDESITAVHGACA